MFQQLDKYRVGLIGISLLYQIEPNKLSKHSLLTQTYNTAKE